MTEKKQDKLPVSQLIGFALNGCGSSCIAGIMGGFLTLYLTDNLLLSMGFITAMMTAARIINAVTEGLSGFLIDMTHTKMGKARPWILGTAFFVALPVFLIFNKIDAYAHVPKEEDDLTPATRENLTLDELKHSWIARANTPCIFISAKERIGIDKLRKNLYSMVREIHAGRYPFNNFLY